MQRIELRLRLKANEVEALTSAPALDERVFSLIGRSGGQGAARTDLAAAIRPKPKADDPDAITTRLEGARLIVSGCMHYQPTGQPGMRFFTAEVGMPFVGTDGIVVVRQEVSRD